MPFSKIKQKNRNGQIELKNIPIIRHLDWIQLYNLIICCCKRNWYVDYQNALKTVNHDVDRNLDIITILRRLRMHGMALTLTNDKATRLFIAN